MLSLGKFGKSIKIQYIYIEFKAPKILQGTSVNKCFMDNI